MVAARTPDLKFAFPRKRSSEEWRAEMADRSERAVYSVGLHRGGARFHVNEAGLHRQLIERLRYEGLRPECDWYWLVYPEALLRFALKRPRWLLDRQGLRALWSVAKTQQFRGDIGIATPSANYPDGRPNAFAQRLPGRLETLRGKRFSLSEIGKLFFELRRETMTDEEMLRYIEGMQ